MCVCVSPSAVHIPGTWQQKLNIAPAARLHSRIMLPIANAGSFPSQCPCSSASQYAPTALIRLFFPFFLLTFLFSFFFLSFFFFFTARPLLFKPSLQYVLPSPKHGRPAPLFSSHTHTRGSRDLITLVNTIARPRQLGASASSRKCEDVSRSQMDYKKSSTCIDSILKYASRSCSMFCACETCAVCEHI